MKLYLVRHGEAEGSAGRAVGHLDLPLSAAGARDIETLAATWQGPAPRIFTSDLRRAVESARILGVRLGVEPVVDARLREVSFGDWDGQLWDEVHQRDRDRLEAWGGRWWELAPPGGETFTDLSRRVLAWLRELPEEEAVMAVAHGGSIRALLAELLAMSRERVFDLHLAPARVSAVEVAGGGCELLFLDRDRFRWHAP